MPKTPHDSPIAGSYRGVYTEDGTGRKTWYKYNSHNEVQYNMILHTAPTVVSESEHVSEFTLTTDTPYLARKGELWGVCCKDLE